MQFSDDTEHHDIMNMATNNASTWWASSRDTIRWITWSEHKSYHHIADRETAQNLPCQKTDKLRTVHVAWWSSFFVVRHPRLRSSAHCDFGSFILDKRQSHSNDWWLVFLPSHGRACVRVQDRDSTHNIDRWHGDLTTPPLIINFMWVLWSRCKTWSPLDQLL